MTTDQWWRTRRLVKMEADANRRVLGGQVQLRGARTLVTGATGGLGRAIVSACRDRGAQLVVTGRDEVVLAQLADEFGAEVHRADLTRSGEVEGLAAAVATVDVVVSNAALPGGGRLDTFSVEEIDRLLDVNLRAGIVLARVLGAGMFERGRGHIVFVSSLAAAFPTPGLSLYNATKSALRTFSLSLRAELTGTGVGVSSIFPGPIADAGMWADTGLAAPAGLRTKSPADVAGAVVRAIERNRAEVTVAAVPLRVGARLGQLSPATVARLAPQFGATRLTNAMADALRHKR